MAQTQSPSRPIASVNPATGQTLKTFASLGDAEIEQKLALAIRAFACHRRTPLAERARHLQAAADMLTAGRERYARLMSAEMGKTLASALGEVDKCALVCRFYAEHGAGFLADVPVVTDATRSFVRYQPLGPVLAVMPWNFPFWQVFRFAAPALMAGNVGLLKHASNVPQCALAIEAIFLEAGFAPGCFQTLLVGAERTADLIADGRVVAVTLTGSEPAGRSVASQAGNHLKKCVLELGGSDPFIVLESADISKAAQTAVTARLINNGQSCIAAKRFIVAEAVADTFEQLLVERFTALKVGDPSDPATDVGPLATPAILKTLDAQVRDSVARGARVLIGGKALPGPGNFYTPTILADIPPDSPAYGEELFGPVAALFRVPDLDAAIRLANDTAFGLGASAWSTDAAEIERLAEEIEAGSIFINGMVKSDPRLPFGGIKLSGYGRELSREGMLEFVNIKTVWEL
ncbi:NAD-dependent succinate-semialdehyde dehydrogenase [Gloeobacter morelensis]|uniref:NAD-dependent succinate-semialdehyde dehydrogenase n=1 Tax=Gloeobacter morelensis MG652769 TaxID=2781736 RepID=A0ABY3PNU3_9CYAN|nr:NAD-dependent succinate-semialdehyde dehydrogenase [Gloeobacter morelensis]UFP95284.1 NAD-dependent succinate-semialdehyde dehydrogenase [Gloeobacter morelensis MG652769]